MGSNSLPLRADGATIDSSWFNSIRQALTEDILPRNSGGVVTDQAGSLGDSTRRYVNAYLIRMLLMNGEHAIKLQTSASLVTSYDLTLPDALPVGNRPLQVSPTGIVTFSPVETDGIADTAITAAKMAANSVATTNIQNGAVTAAKKAALGQVVSASSGTNSSGVTAGYQDIPNLSLVLTTTGRPVYIAIISGSTSGSSFYIFRSGSDPGLSNSLIGFVRNGTMIVSHSYHSVTSFETVGPAEYSTTTSIPYPFYIDMPVAGTYTYKAQVYVNTGAINVTDVKLIAFEL
jgi:hypothetical protein